MTTPDDKIEARLERGWQQFNQGKAQPAREVARTVLRRHPDHPEALRLLGRSMVALGKAKVGLEHLKRAVSLVPADIPAKLDYVVAVWQLGGRDQALKDLLRIIAQAPKHAQARELAGHFLSSLGKNKEAFEQFVACAKLSSDDVHTQRQLMAQFEKMGQNPAVILCARRIAELTPDDKNAHLKLGIALQNSGKRLDAIEAYRRAVEIDPKFGHALYNLGRMLNRTQQHAEAIEVLRRCIEVDPRAALPYNMMGMSLVRQGRIEEAIASYRKANEADPKYDTSRGNLLFASCYVEEDGEKLLELHRDWVRHVPSKLKLVPYRHQPKASDSGRPLRIGYVSADFRDHVVARFLRAPYACHDRSRFHIVSYHTDGRVDSQTAWFKERSDTWRSIPRVDPESLAKQIHADRIDILVDLNGFAGGNHLSAFALKPAPVQATWLGYPATTGLDTIDARFTDSLADPPGTTEAFHSESLVRLDPCFLCYSPWPGSEAFPTDPDDDSRPVTFGSFNNFPKVRPATLDLWARVLQRVPGSRLVLKARSLGDEEPRRMVLERMESHGIDRDRIEFIGNVPDILEHIRLYKRIDIGLDPFPYNGTTTTCEAMWMGVPVVTLAGKLHAGRVGVSLLTNAGLPDLVAETADQYVEIAAGLAADRDRLRQLRRDLRPQMLASPLMDAEAFTQRLESAYQELWSSYLAKSGSAV